MKNDLLEKEIELYNDILLHKPEGDIGRKYLRSRRITQNTAKEWNIGYCPVGYIPPIYKDIHDSAQYDFWIKMWGRIVFEIRDIHGKIISISGRKIIDVPKRGKNPKYDHYPFDARRNLFGLYKNKNDIFKEDKGIITEGQFDVITAWQNGLKTAVSSFGAHCSKTHCILLSRYTSNIFILFDSDYAGYQGLMQAKSKLKDMDLNINYKRIFEKDEDLDSWIKYNSKEDLYKLLEVNRIDNVLSKLKKIKQHM